jgi:hypothetical protein
LRVPLSAKARSYISPATPCRPAPWSRRARLGPTLPLHAVPQGEHIVSGCARRLFRART